MQEETNPHENFMTDAMANHGNKLDDIASSNSVQVDGIIKTNEALDELNSTAELILEGIAKKEKSVAPKIEIEVDGATIEVVEGPKGDNGEKGEKGDKGDKGEDGIDGISPDPQEVAMSVLKMVLPEVPTVEEVVAQIPVPTNGRDGKNGKNGKDGMSVSLEDILDNIPKPKEPETADQIIKKFKGKLSFDDLKDAPDIKNVTERINKISSKTVSLQELDNVDLTGVIITNGKYVLGSGGGGGAVDSVNSQTGVVVLTTADIADSLNKRYVTDANLTTIGNQSGTNTGDNATNSTSNTYADGKVADAINDGTTTIAPSQNAVFDALALKSPIASPTFTGTVTTPALNVSGQTASTIAGFDGSKNLVTLATATYPSLTELTYVKGVTSAIQTQINTKQATLVSGTNIKTLYSNSLLGSGDLKISPRVIFTYFTNAGNGTTVETDLYSSTLSAGLLATDGDSILGRYGGTFAISATATRQVKLYFGGTTIFDSGTLNSTVAYDFDLNIQIIRVSSTVIRYILTFNAGNFFLYPRVLTGELTGLTLSNTNIMKITGTAAGVGAATNDIIAKLGTVIYQPV